MRQRGRAGLGVGLRGRLLVAVLAAVALVLAGLITGFNLLLHQRLAHDARNTVLARTSAELATLHVRGDQLKLPEAPDEAALDSQIWVFSGQRVLESPPTPRANDGAALGLTNSGRRTLRVASTHSELYGVPVVFDGRRLGTVVAAVSLRPYERTEQTALIASLVLGFVVLVVVGVTARLVISGALRPVAAMTAQAAEWRDANIAGRFNLGPSRDEFTQLAATLDSLLERVATTLRHEQRFSAELSHELRTPLTNVMAQAQFALRHGESVKDYRAGYEEILKSAEQMRRTLDTLVAAARLEMQTKGDIGDASQAARAASEACAPAGAERGVRVTVVDPPRPLRVGAETGIVERILSPLIENGCRHGRQTVTVTIESHDGTVMFTVEDDGPGVHSGEHESIFEPGNRGAGRTGRQPDGAGLGLALARRLARSAGGDVQSDPHARGGRFVARLPAA
jgi:signal transduction histidine kinase